MTTGYCRTQVCKKGDLNMTENERKWILNAVKDITIAKMSDSDFKPCKENGEDVSDFMQEIFNKLTELVKKSVTNQK